MNELPGNLEPVLIWTGQVMLDGRLAVPHAPRGIVLFAVGPASPHGAQEALIAAELNRAGIATLLVDLLTPDEQQFDIRTSHFRVDSDFLAQRLQDATAWVANRRDLRNLPAGYFGFSVGGAAALIAAANRPDVVASIVSSGGRTDLAIDVLRQVKTPTLLIVAAENLSVLRMNREALHLLPCEKRLEIIRDATQLLDEPHSLEMVAKKTVRWFSNTLQSPIAADAYGLVEARSAER
ncbi:MAG TPA: dienelactone hydrolase family protein [Thermoanaerobaculia bacterium]|nr:dienelactone hydrolase family protein [Thermoanaerobaculia bacterium]